MLNSIISTLFHSPAMYSFNMPGNKYICKCVGPDVTGTGFKLHRDNSLRLILGGAGKHFSCRVGGSGWSTLDWYCAAFVYEMVSETSKR